MSSIMEKKSISLPPPKIFLQKFITEQLAKINNNNSEPLQVISENNNQLTAFLIPIDFNSNNSESFFTSIDFNSYNPESFLTSIECELPLYSENNCHNFKEESKKKRFVTNIKDFLLLCCPVCGVERPVNRYRGKAGNGKDCLNCCAKCQYKCAICKKIFDLNSAAMRHMRTVHNSRLEDTENIKEPNHALSLTQQSASDKLKFISALCKNCNTKTQVSIVMPEICLNCVAELAFSCEKCSTQLRTFSGALKHGSLNCVRVDAAYKCIDCDCSFYYKDTLERHAREEHMTQSAECPAQHIL